MNVNVKGGGVRTRKVTVGVELFIVETERNEFGIPIPKKQQQQREKNSLRARQWVRPDFEDRGSLAGWNRIVLDKNTPF